MGVGAAAEARQHPQAVWVGHRCMVVGAVARGVITTQPLQLSRVPRVGQSSLTWAAAAVQREQMARRPRRAQQELLAGRVVQERVVGVVEQQLPL